MDDVKSPRNNKVIYLVGGVVAIVMVLVVVALVFGRGRNDVRQPSSGQGNGQSQQSNQMGESNRQSSNSTDRFMQDYGGGCKNNTVAFNYSPLAVNDTRFIQPMGLLNDGHVTPVDHVYVTPKDPNAVEGAYAVVMPADGEVINVQAMPSQYIGDRKGVTLAPDDNRLIVRFSCRYYSIFIHVHQLSPAIKAAVGTLEPGAGKNISLPVKSGEELAKLGNRPFDWTMVDTQTNLTGFISPALYTGEPWKIHSISPFDTYSGDLKTQLESLSLRSVAPLGGKIDDDIKGALIGNWFRDGSGGYSGNNENDTTGRYYDGHLAIVPNYIDPSATMVSIGNWEGSAKQFLVKGSVDPAKVTAESGVVKYELQISDSYADADGKNWDNMSPMPQKPLSLYRQGQMAGTILFQVLPGEKLKVETFPGKSASEVSGFSDKTVMYQR